VIPFVFEETFTIVFVRKHAPMLLFSFFLCLYMTYELNEKKNYDVSCCKLVFNPSSIHVANSLCAWFGGNMTRIQVCCVCKHVRHFQFSVLVC
jgi:hypothetical protein